MQRRPTKDEVLDAITQVARAEGRTPSRVALTRQTGITEYWILKHFPSWTDAVRAAGLQPYTSHVKLTDGELLCDWAKLVRRLRHIPTRDQYRREGTYGPGTFEKRFGPWSTVPDAFADFAGDDPEWIDVLTLTPVTTTPAPPSPSDESASPRASVATGPQPPHPRLAGRPVYGNPIDFRGLRHEPVNENGVILLFGMVARELGYSVEAVQGGFPDCEAKRQVGRDTWQRVRIEFEFESRNFRDHGHSPDHCDVIVCWRHNWPDCPPHLEVVELSWVISELAATDD